MGTAMNADPHATIELNKAYHIGTVEAWQAFWKDISERREWTIYEAEQVVDLDAKVNMHEAIAEVIDDYDFLMEVATCEIADAIQREYNGRNPKPWQVESASASEDVPHEENRHENHDMLGAGRRHVGASRGFWKRLRAFFGAS